jgi:hypothetical protein
MRYALAVLLALGIGMTTAIPGALAQNHIGQGPNLEIHQATSTSHPRRSPADSGNVTSPPSLGPGYNTGYGTVVQPTQPLWVVQFPL